MHALAQSFDCHAMVSQRFYFKQKTKCSCHYYAAIVLRVRFFVIVDLRRTSLHACDTQFAHVLAVLHAISLHYLFKCSFLPPCDMLASLMDAAIAAAAAS